MEFPLPQKYLELQSLLPAVAILPVHAMNQRDYPGDDGTGSTANAVGATVTLAFEWLGPSGFPDRSEVP